MKCNLCKSIKISDEKGKVRDDHRLKVKRCNNCNLLFLSSIKHIDKDFYKNSGMRDYKNSKSIFDKWRKQTLTDDLRRVDQFKSILKNKRVLDFGCGNGNFIQFSSNHSKIYGLEVDLQSLKYIKREGYRIFESINEIPNDLKFDNITLFHVYEHLSEPKKILDELYKVLKENGKIIIEIPNSNDALLSIYNNEDFRNFTFWSNHLYLYDHSNFKRSIKISKFKIEKTIFYQRYPIENHLHWLLKGKPGGHKLWKNKVNNNFKKMYIQSLIKKKATDTLIFIIKKN